MSEPTSSDARVPSLPIPRLVIPPAGSRFFYLLLAAAAVSVWVLMRPLFTPMLFGGVFSIAMSPLQERLSTRFGNRRALAAIVLTAGFVLVILVPVSLLGISVVKQAIQLAQGTIATIRDGGIESVIYRAPAFARKGLDYAVEQLEMNQESLREKVGALGAESVGVLAAVLGGLGAVVVNGVFMLIALVVFLIEGPAVGEFLKRTSPLNASQTKELIGEFRKVSSSIVIANVGTAGAQAGVAMIGFLIARTPNLLVATALTFFLAFVPGVGATGTVIVAAVIQIASGSTGRGVFLAIWGLVVVGLIDNILKPVFMRRGVEMHGALVFFAIVAGLAAFGPAGFMLGPIIAAFALTLTRIYQRDYRNVSDV